MSFTALMIISIIVLLGMSSLFVIATMRAYKFQHTVDPQPKDDPVHEKRNEMNPK